MILKQIPLKQTILTLIFGWMFMLSCNKDSNIVAPITNTCELQLDNPSGRSYSSDSVISFVCSSNYCGFMPLSTKNYWVYQDSIYTDGVFTETRMDTLRFTKTWKSFPDNLVWWQSNIEIGLPSLLYSNDSTIFQISDRLFTPGIKDAKREYGLFAGDSLKYLTSFDDAAALGRSVKVDTELKTPAGNFDNSLLFEKDARNYRRDRIYFQPGIGVLKYTYEKAPMGTFTVKLQQVSTLVSYHIE